MLLPRTIRVPCGPKDLLFKVDQSLTLYRDCISISGGGGVKSRVPGEMLMLHRWRKSAAGNLIRSVGHTSALFVTYCCGTRLSLAGCRLQQPPVQSTRATTLRICRLVHVVKPKSCARQSGRKTSSSSTKIRRINLGWKVPKITPNSRPSSGFCVWPHLHLASKQHIFTICNALPRKHSPRIKTPQPHEKSSFRNFDPEPKSSLGRIK